MNLLKLNPNIQELYILNEFINDITGKSDFQVDLILEEVFVNIVNYSNSDYINVKASFEKLLKKDPETPENIEDAKIGGLGIFLTKKMADEIDYQYMNGENHLIITKHVKI